MGEAPRAPTITLGHRGTFYSFCFYFHFYLFIYLFIFLHILQTVHQSLRPTAFLHEFEFRRYRVATKDLPRRVHFCR